MKISWVFEGKTIRWDLMDWNYTEEVIRKTADSKTAFLLGFPDYTQLDRMGMAVEYSAKQTVSAFRNIKENLFMNNNTTSKEPVKVETEEWT